MTSIVVLFVVAGVIAVVLLVPISVHASGAFGEHECWGRAELCWGYRFATVRLGSGSDGRLRVFGIPLFSVESVSRPSRKKKRRTQRRTLKRARSLSDSRGVLVRMVARVLRALHPRLHIGGTLGLGDPTDTALALTAIHQIDTLVADCIELEFRDDFLEDTTQLFGRVHARMIPVEIVFLVLVWMIRADTRRVLWGK